MTRQGSLPGWYDKDVQSINPDAQSLLERYSGLKSEDVLPHVLSLRDEAFRIFPYPCIGQMRFLALNLRRMPFYHRMLDHLKANTSANFLDAGCCFGQEIRSLVDEGIPSTQLFGCDLEQPFIDLGYRLFRDRDRLKAKFATGDLTADETTFAESELCHMLAGKVDVIFASSLFHLWDYNTSLLAATRLVRMCRDKPGAMITGRQVGSLLGGHYEFHGFGSDVFHYRHNVETFKGFWKDIEEATQTHWRVDADFLDKDAIGEAKNVHPGFDDNTKVLCWSATRV